MMDKVIYIRRTTVIYETKGKHQNVFQISGVYDIKKYLRTGRFIIWYSILYIIK